MENNKGGRVNVRAKRQKISCLECKTDLLQRFIPVSVRRIDLLRHTVSLLTNPAYYSVALRRTALQDPGSALQRFPD